jgi:hypothetical protein
VTDVPIHPDDHLLKNLEVILEVIPNKDAELEFDEFEANFFNLLETGIGNFELTFMQLGKFNEQLNAAFRKGAARLLQDSSIQLNMGTRVFISDLLRSAPIIKRNEQSTLVRDILIIYAVLSLEHMGYRPTKGIGTSTEKPSGCEVVFEYLTERRGLTFAKSEETIYKIWSKRGDRFLQIGLDHLLPALHIERPI